MAAPRPKKKVIPRSAKDIKPGDLRSQVLEKGKPQKAKDLRSTDPKSLRNKALREANRAANENKPRYTQKIGPAQPQGPEAPRYGRKIGPSDKPLYNKKIGPKKPSLARGLLKKIPVIGMAAGFITDAAPAGAGSDKPSGPLMKGNNMKPTFPKGKGSASQPKTQGSPFSKGKGTAAQPKSSGSDSLRKAGAGTYTASYDVKAKKSGSAKAASVAPAKASSGTSQAAKTKRRSPTRYQRNETAMEQKRSSNRPKKSIFSLFRKG